MKIELRDLRKSIFAGLLQGLRVWTIYGIVEFCLSSAVPWLFQESFRFSLWHWRFIAVLFLFYALVGVVSGGVIGLLFYLSANRGSFLKHRELPRLNLAISMLSMVLIFAMNLAIRFSLDFRIVPVFAISLLFISYLLLYIIFDFKRLQFFVNPWFITIALLSSSLITIGSFHNSLWVVKNSVAIAFIAVVSLFVFFINRIRRAELSSWKKSLIPLATVEFFILLMSFFWIQWPPEFPRLNSSNSIEKPNVLLIVMDTVGAAHMSLYGYGRETTPNLEKFSREATVFYDGVASGDMTLSTHASIFTGMYARKHGAHFNNEGLGQSLKNQSKTLAEILSSQGYSTLGVVANHVFFGSGYGLEQGFDYLHAREADEYVIFHALGQTEKFYLKQTLHRLLKEFGSKEELETHYPKAEEINNEVFKLLDKTQKRPFFLFVNYMDTHWPYMSPKNFRNLYEGKDEEFTSIDFYKLLTEVVRDQCRQITDKERQHLISQYDGAITYVDSQIGKLLNRLKKHEFYDNTMIIITSDHGEAFGAKNLVQHGVSVYQDQIHIPLILKYPKTKQKIAAEGRVSVVDILPTVLDVLGLEIPNDVDGESLKKPGAAELRTIVSESYPNTAFLGPRFLREERAIFWEYYKFISSTNGKRELYNLISDPNEQQNIYGQNDISLELERKLDTWLTSISTESDQIIKLDKVSLERLRSLGYIK